MGIEKGILKAAMAAELILSACTPLEHPYSANIPRIVKETPINKDQGIFSLRTRVSNLTASDNNTTFRWEARYCAGQLTVNFNNVIGICEGLLLEAEGEDKANVGELLGCPEIPEGEKIECFISDADPEPTRISPDYRDLGIN